VTDAQAAGDGPIEINCYAKINLTLDVDLPREDGLHPLRSIMQTVALHDTLTASRSDTRGIRLTITGPETEGIPTNGTNLVLRAIRLLGDACCFDITSRGLRIDLIKNIPSQAGLGGGSSNAAATLIAVRRLFNLDLTDDELNTLARTLGSDVPFFLKGGTALIEGTGEQCRPITAAFPPHPVLIAKGPNGISTKEAYAALDAAAHRKPGESTDAFLTSQQAGLLPRMNNDFQEIVAAISPDVQHTLSLFEQASSDSTLGPAILCGSGASVFKLYSNDADAARDAAILEAAGQSVFLTSLLNDPTT